MGFCRNGMESADSLGCPGIWTTMILTTYTKGSCVQSSYHRSCSSVGFYPNVNRVLFCCSDITTGMFFITFWAADYPYLETLLAFVSSHPVFTLWGCSSHSNWSPLSSLITQSCLPSCEQRQFYFFLPKGVPLFSFSCLISLSEFSESWRAKVKGKHPPPVPNANLLASRGWVCDVFFINILY